MSIWLSWQHASSMMTFKIWMLTENVGSMSGQGLASEACVWIDYNEVLTGFLKPCEFHDKLQSL